MKTIPLTQGKVAIVDDEDYAELAKYKWHAVRDRATYYAERKPTSRDGVRRSIKMHRQILGLQHDNPLQIDHINHDGLDNRRRNIRSVTCAENQWNSSRRGYCWSKAARRWLAKIRVNGRVIYLGLFHDPVDARKAYIAAKDVYHRIEC